MNYDIWLQTDVAFEEREKRWEEALREVERQFGNSRLYLLGGQIYPEDEILEALEFHYGKDDDGFNLEDWEITTEEAALYI